MRSGYRNSPDPPNLGHIAPVVELVDTGASKTPAFGRARSIRAGGIILITANVAELVDAPDLGSGDFGREGSTPSIGTIFCFAQMLELVDRLA